MNTLKDTYGNPDVPKALLERLEGLYGSDITQLHILDYESFIAKRAQAKVVRLLRDWYEENNKPEMI